MSENVEQTNLDFVNQNTNMITPIIHKMSKDMKFVGILSIIYGAMQCLTIIGAIIGVPLIIAGLRLRDSADAYFNYAMNNDVNALNFAYERQSRFFNIIKILGIISLILTVLVIIFYIILIATMGSSFMHQMNANRMSY